MPLFLAPIFSAVAAWFASAGSSIVALVTIEGLKFTAQKVFWMFMIMIVFPLILYNIGVTLITNLIAVGIHFTELYAGDPEGVPLILNLTGMGGWIAEKIMIPQALSTYLSAVGARFILSFIPLVGK